MEYHSQELEILNNYNLCKKNGSSDLSIIDLLQMKLTVKNISMALNIPEETLKYCQVEENFIEPVQKIQAAAVKFRKQTVFSLINYMSYLKDYSQKYETKYSGFLQKFIDKEDDIKFEKTRELIVRDFNQVKSFQTDFIAEIHQFFQEFSESFELVNSFAKTMQGELKRLKEEKAAQEKQRDENKKIIADDEEKLKSLNAEGQKLEESRKNLVETTYDYQGKKIDNTKDIEILTIDENFCDFKIENFKYSKENLADSIKNLESSIQTLKKEYEAKSNKLQDKIDSMNKEKQELMKELTKKHEELIKEEKNKVGFIDKTIGFFTGWRPLKAATDFLSPIEKSCNINENIQLKGINHEISEKQRELELSSSSYKENEKELQKEIDFKKKKMVFLEESLKNIDQSIMKMGENKNQLAKKNVEKTNEIKEFDLKIAKINEELQKCLTEIAEKKLDLQTRKKTLEENEKKIKDLEFDIIKTEKYMKDIEKLQLPEEFVKTVQSFKIVFDKLHNAILKIENDFSKKHEKKMEFDTDCADLEDDPKMAKLDYKKGLDNDIKEMTLSIEDSRQKCIEYKLLDK